MEYLLVVYFLMNGVWVRGDELEGWASVPYPTQELCLARKARAEEIHADLKRINPRAYDKRFECEPHEAESGG
jgi:hypothetical protein